MIKCTKSQMKYLKENYGVEGIPDINDEAFDTIYEDLCDKEISNLLDGNDDSMISSLVTVMGNMIREHFYSDDEDEDDDATI